MHEGGRKYVAFAAPGDRLQLKLSDREKDRAGIIQVLHPGRDRAVPACGHFGVCGGCAMQHFDFTAQVAAKQRWLAGVPEEKVLLSSYGWSPERMAARRFSMTRSGRRPKRTVSAGS